MKLEPSYNHTQKISKWVNDLNVTPESIKLLKEDIGHMLFDISLTSFPICIPKQGKPKKGK